MTISKYSAEERGEAARFVTSAPQTEIEKAYGAGVTSADIFVDLTWDEIVEKYRAYKTFADTLRVGNEVVFTRDGYGKEPMVVTAKSVVLKKPMVVCLTGRGRYYTAYTEDLVATGRDYPQIREVLEAMRGKATPEKRKAPAPDPAKLGCYRHYKGGFYMVIANGYLESTGEPAVIYKSHDTGKIWVRSLANWSETVEVCDANGIYSEVPRFAYLGERL